MAKEYLDNLERSIETSRKKLQGSSISDRNKELILRFVKEHRLRKNLALPSVRKYLLNLRIAAEILQKDFDTVLESRDDLINLMDHLQTQPGYRGKRYGENSIYDFKKTIKVFFKWLYNKGDQAPPCVDWIKVSRPPHKEKLPEDVLAREDVLKMVRAARTIRDKALIYGLWESGCRRTEFFTRRIKHLVFDQYGAVLIVEGKTGMRRIRLVESMQYIAQWLNTHPQRDNAEAHLWVCIDSGRLGQRLSNQSIVDALSSAAKRAGVQKRVNPHSFRGSRATFLASRITEQQLKVLMGWTKDSEMCAKYVHLSGKDVDNALLRINGITMPESPEDTAVHVCAVCQFINSPDSKFCGRCSKPLSVALAMKKDEENAQVDDVMNRIFADPQKAAIIKGWVAEMAAKR